MKSKDMLRFVELLQQAFKKRMTPSDLKDKPVVIVVDDASMWTTIRTVSAVEGKNGLLFLGIDRVVTQLVYDFKKGTVAEIAQAEREDGAQVNELIKMKMSRYSFTELQYDGHEKEWSIVAVQEPISDIMARISLWVAAHLQDDEDPKKFLKEHFPDIGSAEEWVLRKKVKVVLI
jgi:hypothetical protein